MKRVCATVELVLTDVRLAQHRAGTENTWLTTFQLLEAEIDKLLWPLIRQACDLATYEVIHS